MRPDLGRLRRTGLVAADLRYAGRALRKSPLYAGAAILTLGLGIGANSAIYSVADALFFAPLPYPEPDRLVQVWNSRPLEGALRWGVSLHDFEDWVERNGTFEALAAYASREGNLATSEEPVRASYALVTPRIFAVLGIEPMLGRAFSNEENDPGRDGVAILTHDLWRQHLGADRDVLGKRVELDGEVLRVVGVLPPKFVFPHGEVDVLKPFGMRPDDAGSRNSYWVRSVGRLLPGVSVEEAQRDLSRIMQQLEEEYPETNSGIGGYVEPLREFQVGYLRPAVLLLWCSVCVVLLIACVNVANLSLARSAHRRQELDLRTALGATRLQVARLLLAESLLLGALGAGCGLLMAGLLLRSLPRLAAGSLPKLESAGLGGPVLLFAFLLSILAAGLFGIVPAVRSARRPLLHRAANADAGRLRIGRLLVVAEIALALTLLATAGLLLRSLEGVLAVEPGFRSQGLLTLRVEPPQRVQSIERGGDLEGFLRRRAGERAEIGRFYRALQEDLVAVPGVVSAAAVNRLPLAGNWWGTELRIEGRESLDPQQPPRAFARVITPGYLETLDIPLLEGRRLAWSDHAEARPVAVIGSTMARRYWPDGSPLGSRFTLNGPEDPIQVYYTVVGVVGDVHHGSLESAPGSLFYTTLDQSIFGHFGDWGMDIVVRVAEGDPLAHGAVVRSILRRHAPDLPGFDLRSIEGMLRESVNERRFNTVLLGLFALLALFLAGVGLYGLIAQGVALRAQELSIRRALGASPRRLLLLVLRQEMTTVAIGLLLGLLGAAGATRLVDSLLFQVTSRDPVTFSASVLILVLVALAASLTPAWRQSRVDPMVSLRSE